jgi:hypothetical protein
VVWLAQRSANELHRFRTDDPAVWEPAIAGLEQTARDRPPPPEAVLFLGASTIRFWTTIEDDLAPLEAVARGFGGAKIADVIHYADRLTRPRPRAVVLAVGGNDLFGMAGNEAKPPEEVVALSEQLVERIAELLPGVPIYWVSIRPPILDPQGRDPSSRVNARIRELAGERSVGYIDANVDLYGEDGELLEGLRAWDRSQLSREGYRRWSAPIRQRLLRDLGTPMDETSPSKRSG